MNRRSLLTGNVKASNPGNRRAFLKTAVAGAAIAATAQAMPRSPNIVVIICDDLGYGDLNCYGANFTTPNLDRMALEGIRFTHGYSAACVCTPARAALMTGRYPNRYGVPRVIDPEENYGIPDSETTMAQMLKGAGYATMCVGKWHLGAKPEFLPTNRGFDSYFGIPYSIDMTPRVLLENTTVIEQQVDLTTLTQRYTQRAIDFINRSKNSPFFLYLGHAFPHIPYTASTPFVGNSGEGLYADSVQEIDFSTGQILQALMDNGLDSNTIVVFTSDHGPWYQGSTGKLRKRKGEIFEGGVRVPLIARMPGYIPSGQVSNTLVSLMDWMPTLAGLAGAPLPAKPLDGIDIWPVLSGQQVDLPRDPLLCFNDLELQAARSGAWKLHVARFNTWMFSPIPVEGRMSLPLPNPELYNVVSDVGENHDRADRNPGIAAGLRASMDRQMQTFPPGIQEAWSNTLKRKVYYTPSGALPMPVK
jgi:arylsulfatase A